MTGNLLHTAVDSIHDGEPVETVIDRVIRLYGKPPSEKAEAAVDSMLADLKQRSLSDSTGSSGSSGINGGLGAKGPYSNGKMNGNRSGKLMGKGVVQTLHTAYAPDDCALKYPPTTKSKAYDSCRKKKDKTESQLDEIIQPKMVVLHMAFHEQSTTVMKLLGLWPFSVMSVTKMLKKAGVKYKKLEDVDGYHPSDLNLLLIMDSRSSAKQGIAKLKSHIKKLIGNAAGRIQFAALEHLNIDFFPRDSEHQATSWEHLAEI